MKVFIINMACNIERFVKCSKQLDAVGVEYERFAAIEGKSLQPEEINKYYNDKNAQRLLGKSMSRGEIGCVLSHIGIYKQKLVKMDYVIKLIVYMN